MMRVLSDILYGVSLREVHGKTNISIKSITFDSREVKRNAIFVAIKGTRSDGHDHIYEAIDAGAVAVIVEKLPDVLQPDITYCKASGTARALGIMASNFYGQPSLKLQLIGITGTNGKTTVSTLLYRLFEKLGYKCGLLSTIENRVHQKKSPATHTTPDPVQINALLAQMAATGCEFCFMEVSSHAVDQERISGLTFKGAVFMNITHDHLDYHGSFDKYITAKKKLFDNLPENAFALTNMDDKRGKVMLQNTRARKLGFSLKGAGEYNARVVENTFSGLVLNMDGEELHSPMVGKFNAYNLLSVYAAARALNADKMQVLRVLSSLTPAEGRFEYVRSEKEGVTGIVDYAHTPDALKNVLQTIQAVRSGKERLITVIGCGGDRDKGKRPVMGRVSAELSDKVILTADNPRSEDPDAIIAEMLKGILPPLNKKVITINNRREAIRTASMMAEAGDIILVAGKGHEKYQEIKGKRNFFDDKEELVNAFKIMEK